MFNWTLDNKHPVTDSGDPNSKDFITEDKMEFVADIFEILSTNIPAEL
jgi:hypothetical protein